MVCGGHAPGLLGRRRLAHTGRVSGPPGRSWRACLHARAPRADHRRRSERRDAAGCRPAMDGDPPGPLPPGRCAPGLRSCCPPPPFRGWAAERHSRGGLPVLPGLFLLLAEATGRRRLTDLGAWSGLVVLASAVVVGPAVLTRLVRAAVPRLHRVGLQHRRGDGWLASFRGTSHWVAFFPAAGGSAGSGATSWPPSRLLLFTTVLVAAVGSAGRCTAALGTPRPGDLGACRAGGSHRWQRRAGPARCCRTTGWRPRHVPRPAAQRPQVRPASSAFP